MKFQRTNYTCGPASLVNAFRCLDKDLTEELASRLAGTTKDGTNDFDLCAAITLLGYRMQQTVSEQDVRRHIALGHPVVLASFNDKHWVTVIGIIGDKFVIFDPDNSSGNRVENGTYVTNMVKLKTDCIGLAITGRIKVAKWVKKKERSR